MTRRAGGVSVTMVLSWLESLSVRYLALWLRLGVQANRFGDAAAPLAGL